ncbi:MAG: peroxiredoxin-like family protein [Alphaproteobacteria bacterium]
MLKTRQPAPALSVPTLDGKTFTLADARPRTFTLIVAYRGLHCPACATYVGGLEGHVAAFAERGVEVVALSMDGRDRADAAREKWGLDQTRVGYDLPLQTARDWGLAISTSRGKTSIGIEEPALFSEPGLFMVRADGTLYLAATQTMPFARPQIADLLKATDFILEKDYPARGEA